MGNCFFCSSRNHGCSCSFRHSQQPKAQVFLAEMVMMMKEGPNLRTLIRLQQQQEAEASAASHGAVAPTEEETDDDDDDDDEEDDSIAPPSSSSSLHLRKHDPILTKTFIVSPSSLHQPSIATPLQLSLQQHLKLRHGSCRHKIDGFLDDADLSLDFAAWISGYCCSRHSHGLLQLSKSAETGTAKQSHRHLHHHLHENHQHLHHQLHCQGSCCSVHRPLFAAEAASAANHLRIFALTWNVNGKKSAMADLGRFIASLDNAAPYDLFVVGLQEVPNHDAEKLLLRSLGQGHRVVAKASMSSLQLVVISRAKVARYVQEVKMDRVGAGVVYGAVTGRQKGAVAVSFKLNDASMLFIASHLSPHECNLQERNLEFQRISQCLFSPRPPPPRLPSCLAVSSHHHSRRTFHLHGPASNALDESDFVVWLGDLNYRIQDNRNHVDDLINQNRYMCLKHKDQLSREIEKGNVFKGFREGPLSFRPTYKYDVGTDNYDTSPKERVPSWTDRILYKVNNNKGCFFKVGMSEYDAIDSIKSSDHRPVKAVFTLSPHLL